MENDSVLTSRTNTRTSKMPATNFFSLPLELRQKILFMTHGLPRLSRFEIVSPEGPHYTAARARRDFDNNYRSYIIHLSIGRRARNSKTISLWTKQLQKVHPVMKADMNYVKRQWRGRQSEWMAEVERIYQESEGIIIERRLKVLEATTSQYTS